MTNIKKNERFIPLKNYFLAGLVVVVVIALVWYGFAWYNVLKESKVSTSYLVKEKIVSKEITDLNEVSNVFSEVPSNYFVYVSYTGNEEIYEMEKTLKSIIADYNLNDTFYFLNITNIKEQKDKENQVNEALHLDNVKVTHVPTIIYFRDSKAIDIITREDDNMMDAGDFQKMLDVNNISK